MICARCKKEIEAGCFGSFSRETLCFGCYDAQMREVLQDVAPMGDTKTVATSGGTLDKVSPAVKDNLK